MQGEAFCAQAASELCPQRRGAFHNERLEADEPVLVVEQRTIEFGEELEHLVPPLVLAATSGLVRIASKYTAEPVHERLIGFRIKEQLLDLAGSIEKGEQDAVVRDGVNMDTRVETRR